MAPSPMNPYEASRRSEEENFLDEERVVFRPRLTAEAARTVLIVAELAEHQRVASRQTRT